MKTTTKISAIAYDVELVDLRTGEHLKDRVVLERSWLDVLNKMDISDHDFIMQAYNKKGYYLLKMETKKKVTLTVDLGQIYQNFVDLEQGASACDAE